MITRVLDGTFRVTLALFLLGGASLVATQAIGLIVGQGTVVTTAVDWIGTPTFVLAGFTGLVGFVLSYLKGWETGD